MPGDKAKGHTSSDVLQSTRESAIVSKDIVRRQKPPTFIKDPYDVGSELAFFHIRRWLLKEEGRLREKGEVDVAEVMMGLAGSLYDRVCHDQTARYRNRTFKTGYLDLAARTAFSIVREAQEVRNRTAAARLHRVAATLCQCQFIPWWRWGTRRYVRRRLLVIA